jgi:hypothetical protein
MTRSDDPAPQSPQLQPLPLSRRLAQIIEEHDGERLTFSKLTGELHSRAWGGILFIFGGINVLPLPPGTSWLFALPLIIVSAQMVLGRASPWFPKWLDRRGITTDLLRQLVHKIDWLEARVERIFKPRLASLTGTTAARLIGLACFFLAIVAAIPIPLFHVAPAAAIVLFGLALIYRDGVLVIAATLAGILSIVVDILVIGSGVAVLKYALDWFGA